MVKWEDYGESSLTLLAVYCGMDKDKPAIPYDCSDFKRCIHLFDCLKLDIFQRIDLLHETKKKYPEWGLFVETWTRLTNLYNLNKQYELYELMLEIRKQSSGEKDNKFKEVLND